MPVAQETTDTRESGVRAVTFSQAINPSSCAKSDMEKENTLILEETGGDAVGEGHDNVRFRIICKVSRIVKVYAIKPERFYAGDCQD